MGDTVQFVDAISASPTVRLNVNDETTWSCALFEAPPPRLRRSVSANTMRDGVHVSSAQYEARPIKMQLELRTASQDTNATQLQTLFRELDRENNLLEYQPAGATKPVFFRLYRSDTSAVRDISVQTAMRVLEVELLAEPFALGLKEALGPFTVSNNPAAGSNGAFVDVTGVIGDVATPALIQNTSRWAATGLVCGRLRGIPADLVFFKQAEACTTFSNDTTNPGGGPDAAMSGTGVNNFVRTAFTTATMIMRVEWDVSADVNTVAEQVAARGDFRVVAAVRRSSTTSTLTVRATVGSSSTTGPVVGRSKVLPAETGRMLVDLGVFSLAPGPRRLPNQQTDVGVSSLGPVVLSASRSGGSDTLDWDCIFLFPADEQAMFWEAPGGLSSDSARDQLIDGYQDRIYQIVGSDPFASTSTIGARTEPIVTGGFPRLVPNQTNRVFIQMGTFQRATPVADTQSLTFHYWPRYLYVRPSAT